MATDPAHMGRPEAIKHVRNKLGCGLREAFDFYMKDPSTFASRLEKQVAHQSTTGTYYESPEEKIRTVLREHHEALARGVKAAQSQALALTKIEAILGMKPLNL
jgi:hypothetical protein